MPEIWSPETRRSWLRLSEPTCAAESAPNCSLLRDDSCCGVRPPSWALLSERICVVVSAAACVVVRVASCAPVKP
jgi:hypothetical protein